MYALDTNILVYAHNIKSPYHKSAKAFVKQAMNTWSVDGQLTVCLPAQVLVEFLNVITWSRIESPLPLPKAIQVIQGYIDTGVTILHPRLTQLQTVIDLLKSVTTRKKIFDVALVATLKDHNISGLYTANTKDFEEFSFLGVKNPLSL